MNGQLLDGLALARAREPALWARVAALTAAGHPPPALAVLVAAGDRRAMANARLKAEACRRTGMECRLVPLEAGAVTAAVLAEIDRLNADPRVHGVFVQLPLPPGLDERRCCDRVPAWKDVDCGSAACRGRLALDGLGGAGGDAFAVATPAGIMQLLAHHGIGVAGRRAVVVGDGAALARPMAQLLLRADATVTICPAAAPGLAAAVASAEVVVGAAGLPRHVRAAWIGDGAVVIDLGFHPAAGPARPAPVGDVEVTADLARRCRAWTPVPGGAGPMTVAVLLAHTVAAAERAIRTGR